VFDLKIDENVKMPEYRMSHRFRFNHMKVGDSVFFEGQNSSGKSVTALRNFGHREGWKVSARTVEGGVRVWRVK